MQTHLPALLRLLGSPCDGHQPPACWLSQALLPAARHGRCAAAETCNVQLQIPKLMTACLQGACSTNWAATTVPTPSGALVWSWDVCSWGCVLQTVTLNVGSDRRSGRSHLPGCCRQGFQARRLQPRWKTHHACCQATSCHVMPCHELPRNVWNFAHTLWGAGMYAYKKHKVTPKNTLKRPLCTPQHLW